jgi:hypothetical protein
MSFVGDKFLKAFGKAEPEAPNGLKFTNSGARQLWDGLHKEIGSGWFRGGFLYLFGEGLEALQPCLDAWSFLVQPHPDRMIIGRNGYGTLLVLENGNTMGAGRVFVLDPYLVTYWGHPSLDLISLIGRWLPNNSLGTFLEDGAYKDWCKANKAALDLEDVLGFKLAKGLGGKVEAANLSLEGIVEYYESTGPIYAKAFADLAKKPSSP